jgi:hypothetical protein
VAGVQLPGRRRRRPGRLLVCERPNARARSDATFLDFGIPYRFDDWDLTFLTWLQQTGKQVDFLSDQDIDAVPSGDERARLRHRDIPGTRST